MSSPILYCGDTELNGAASYLAGVMAHAGLALDYLPSLQPLSAADLDVPRDLIIFSDYPAAGVSVDLHSKIVQLVAEGCGLLMIGGWESFHGLGGDWDGTPTAELLGLEISSTDDRCNSETPALLHPAAAHRQHPILRDLPWDDRPPWIGGWNVVGVRTASVLLQIQTFTQVQRAETGAVTLKPGAVLPGLTVQPCGRGRAVAFLSDVAPHWVGSLVDWGPSRVSAQGPQAPTIEVGSLYAQFLAQLVRWSAGLS